MEKDYKYPPKKSVGPQGKGKGKGTPDQEKEPVADQQWINAITNDAQKHPGKGGEAEITGEVEIADYYMSRNMVLLRLKIVPAEFSGRAPVIVTSLEFLQDDLRTFNMHVSTYTYVRTYDLPYYVTYVHTSVREYVRTYLCTYVCIRPLLIKYVRM